MPSLITKVKAGSPIGKKDLLDGLKWCLNRQPFYDFYVHGNYDDYISCVPETDEAKEALAKKVNEELEHLFSPIFATLDRLNYMDKVRKFLRAHDSHGTGCIVSLRQGQWHLRCAVCSEFIQL